MRMLQSLTKQALRYLLMAAPGAKSQPKRSCGIIYTMQGEPLYFKFGYLYFVPVVQLRSASFLLQPLSTAHIKQ